MCRFGWWGGGEGVRVRANEQFTLCEVCYIYISGLIIIPRGSSTVPDIFFLSFLPSFHSVAAGFTFSSERSRADASYRRLTSPSIVILITASATIGTSADSKRRQINAVRRHSARKAALQKDKRAYLTHMCLSESGPAWLFFGGVGWCAAGAL